MCVVLVVDDSAMVRMRVARTLTDGGFEVAVAEDGLDAWEKLTNGLRPRLIVCDINMPRMNGLELLETLREQEEFDDLAIVMLTTEGQPELIRRARGLGARGWLVKPLQPELLLTAAARLTGVSEAA